MLNDTVDAPIGKLVVKVANDSATHDSPVYVSRRGYQDATGDYASNLSVTLSDEKSTVINLSFKDVCIQRAEDVLNTVIAVYNENWIKDKNQIAVSTSAFISDRLGVIEQELGNVDENISSYKSEHLLPDVQAAITSPIPPARTSCFRPTRALKALASSNKSWLSCGILRKILTTGNSRGKL